MLTPSTIHLRRTGRGYARSGYEITPARLDGRRAWRVRDVEGLSATDFIVPTLKEIRRWFAWLEGGSIEKR